MVCCSRSLAASVFVLLVVAFPMVRSLAATPFHHNDFQSGTTEGWDGALLSLPTGGQSGPADRFLSVTSQGGIGPGSHLATYNLSSDWTGDFLVAQIQSISVDLMNAVTTGTSLAMRAVLFGPTLNDRWTSATPIQVPNDGIWRRYQLPLDEPSLLHVAGMETIEQLLQGVIRVMLRHDATGSANGTEISAVLGIDNVTLNGVLAGDFDRDLDLDADDIDALVGEIVAGNQSPGFDLTGDGLVDHSDLLEWRVLGGARNLPDGSAYRVGDADLNGLVEVSDFDIWNLNRFTTTPQWSRGDFNADGSIRR